MEAEAGIVMVVVVFVFIIIIMGGYIMFLRDENADLIRKVNDQYNNSVKETSNSMSYLLVLNEMSKKYNRIIYIIMVFNFWKKGGSKNMSEFLRKRKLPMKLPVFSNITQLREHFKDGKHI